MLSILLAATVAAASLGAPAARAPLALAPAAVASAPQAAPLHCRITAGDAKRRCAVAIPAGRTVRACVGGARCDRSNKYVAHVVETGGASCRISKKRTKWARNVVATMSKTSAKSKGATCDLYVELS